MSKLVAPKLKINWPPAGSYLVAVSGGVDSMVLLDLLARSKRHYQLTVAYFDHGWRLDTETDRSVVATAAEAHGLTVIFGEATTKSETEAAAREQRYEFLEAARVEAGAQAIITAHHADDRLETAVFNVLRGTGSAGLVALQSTEKVIRPLLNTRKTDITSYAQQQGLSWHEDTTNTDTKYARNFIRHELLPPDSAVVDQALALIDRQTGSQAELEAAVAEWLRQFATAKTTTVEIKRQFVDQLTLPELEAVLWQVARQLKPEAELSRQNLSEAARFAKIAPTGQQHQLPAGVRLESGNATISISSTTFRHQK